MLVRSARSRDRTLPLLPSNWGAPVDDCVEVEVEVEEKEVPPASAAVAASSRLAAAIAL